MREEVKRALQSQPQQSSQLRQDDGSEEEPGYISSRSESNQTIKGGWNFIHSYTPQEEFAKSDERRHKKIRALATGSDEMIPSFHPVPRLASSLHEKFSQAVQDSNTSSVSGLITTAALDFLPKCYDPDFPVWSTATRRYDPFTVPSGTALKLDFSDKSLRVLESSVLNQFHVSSFTHLLAQAQQAVLEAGFTSQSQMEEFYQANQALLEASNDLLLLSSQSLTNFNLLRRDMLLATQRDVSKDATCRRKSRLSSLAADRVFGTETQAAVDEHNNSAATITTSILSARNKRQRFRFSAKSAFKSVQNHSFRRRGDADRFASGYRRYQRGSFRGRRDTKPSATVTSTSLSTK